MTTAEQVPCVVTLLLPHATRTAVLAGDGGLPTLRMTTDEPLLREILAATDLVDADTAVVLRQVMTTPPHGSDGERIEREEIALLLELEPGSAAPRDGWQWHHVDDRLLGRVSPEATREALARWAQERAGGWSPTRPPWSLPGWFARASAWMVEQLAAAGLPVVDGPRQHQVWGLSVLLRASTTDGDAFFKASADIFRREAAITSALARRTPDLVPEVIAVDEVQGWLLMRDLAAADLGSQDETSWGVGVEALARVQLAWSDDTAELVGLGLPERSLTALATDLEALSEDAVFLGRMSDQLRDRWLATLPELLESCRRLAELPPAPTLVHGDFHPWNVALGTNGPRVFDWTDAAVSHPFVDLATYVFRTSDVSARRSMVEACLTAWSHAAPPDVLEEAAGLALVVGALYQVQTYRALLPTLMRNGADDGMSESDLGWVGRALSRHERGLESQG